MIQISGRSWPWAERGHEDRGAVQDPRDAEIDAAADDDDRLPHRDDAGEGSEGEEGGDVRWIGEAGRIEAHEREQQQRRGIGENDGTRRASASAS